MKALAFLAACSAAAPLPAAPRHPTPGVSPHWYPVTWEAPAVLCVERTRLVFSSTGWRCL